MRFNRLSIVAVVSPLLALSAVGQAPTSAAAPPPAPFVQSGPTATHTSRIRNVVYGPGGEVQAIALRDGITASLSPDFAQRLQSQLRKGERVRVTGQEMTTAGQKQLAVQQITVQGQTLSAVGPAVAGGPGAAPAPPPPPPAGPGGPVGRPGCAPPPPPSPGAGAPPPPAQAGSVPPPPPAAGVAPPAPPLNMAAAAPPPPPPCGAAPPPPPPQGGPVPPRHPQGGAVPPPPPPNGSAPSNTAPLLPAPADQQPPAGVSAPPQMN